MVTFTPSVYGSVSDTLRLFGAVAGGVLEVGLGNSPIPLLSPSSAAPGFRRYLSCRAEDDGPDMSNSTINDLVIGTMATSNSAFFVDPAGADQNPVGWSSCT